MKILNAGGNGSQALLFSGIKPPQRSDFESQLPTKVAAAEAESPASSAPEAKSSGEESPDGEAKEGVAGAGPKGAARELTRDERIQQVWTSVPSPGSDAANGFPFDVWQIQSALLQAEQLLLSDRNEESDLAREKAEQILAAVNVKVAKLRENTILSDSQTVASYRTWLGLQLDQPLTGQQVAECEALIEALKAPESRADVLPAEKKTAAFQNQLTAFLLKRISRNRQRPCGPVEQIQAVRGLLSHAVFADWTGPGKVSLPWLTFRRLMETTPETADGWVRVESIVRLIEQRRQALALSVGMESSAEGRLVSRRVVESCCGKQFSGFLTAGGFLFAGHPDASDRSGELDGAGDNWGSSRKCLAADCGSRIQSAGRAIPGLSEHHRNCGITTQCSALHHSVLCITGRRGRINGVDSGGTGSIRPPGAAR